MPELTATRLHRSRRQARRRKKLIRGSIRVAGMTAAATVLLIVGAVVAWRSVAEWRLGRIELTNDGRPLKVQVCDETGDRPIGKPVELVNRTTLALPDGEYRLRVDGTGRLGQKYRFAINRGETSEHALSLDEGRLLGRGWYPGNGPGNRPREEPMPFALLTTALELTPGRADLVEYTGQSVIRRDAASGNPIWDTAKSGPSTPYDPARDPVPWLRRIGPGRWSLHFIEPAIDLDGDGTRDVILAVGMSKSFLALSGKDGLMLWNYTAELDEAGGPRPKEPGWLGPSQPDNRPGSLIGMPAIGDVDGDLVPDLISTVVFQEFKGETEKRLGRPGVWLNNPSVFRRSVQAISGRSGHVLWSHPVDSTFTWNRMPFWDRPAALVRGRRMSIVAIEDGSQWIALDPSTGRPRTGPIDLGFVPVRPIQYADLDGDGEPEIVAVGPGPAPQQQSLAVFACGNSQPLWTATVRAPYLQVRGNNLDFESDWPWFVDLDGDGRAELVVPDSGALNAKAGYRGVQLLDGSTGQARWVRPMRPETKANDGLHLVLEAPDLDGDGVRDLVAVSRFEGRNPPASPMERRYEPLRVYVDLLSGRDGRPLWTWHADIPENKLAHIWAPRWWGRGPDGWPMLAVPVGGRDPERNEGFDNSSYIQPPVVHVLETATGRSLHDVLGLSQAGFADLDGDSLTDLWGEADGQLRAFRGEPPEAWRALGRYSSAWREDRPGNALIECKAADLNGDGIGDTLGGRLYMPGNATSEASGGVAIARSGRDGHLLWKSALDSPWFWFEPEHGRSYGLTAFPLPAGDLDGDGTPDVLVQKYKQDASGIGRRPATLPLQVLSGRDGRQLWSAGPLPLEFEAHGYSEVVWAEPRIIERNAPPDLVVLHRSPFVSASPKPVQTTPQTLAQVRLARVSGRTGHILWDIMLEDQLARQEPGNPVPPSIEDLDGDGSLDAVVAVPKGSRSSGSDHDLRAISLRDGATLWTRVLHYQHAVYGPPHIEIGKPGSGEAATVFVAEAPSTKTSNELVVNALDGRDGSDRWNWRAGVREGLHRVMGDIDLMALDGPEKDAICVTCTDYQRESRILILDNQGQERGRRSIPPNPVPPNYAPAVLDWMTDLDGDGRDELLVWHDNRLHAWGRDLKELWSYPAQAFPSLRILRPSPGCPSTLILNQAIALDGISGQVRWNNASSSPWGNRFGGSLLDPGDSTRLPLLISTNLPTTTCRYALPTTPEGTYLPPSGVRVPPGQPRDDARWTRPLPWSELILHTIGPRGFLAIGGLALVNLLLPIAIIRLATRRRRWSVASLMALPVAAAVPLFVFRAIEPLIPVQIGSLAASDRLVFTLGTIAGIPLVTFGFVACWSLIRRRWRPLVLLADATVLTSIVVAAVWLWIDSRSMPSIEHYDWSNWFLAIIPGTCLIGILLPVGWIVRRIHRGLTRRGLLREGNMEPAP